jgi:hypothetical protein
MRYEIVSEAQRSEQEGEVREAADEPRTRPTLSLSASHDAAEHEPDR